MDFEKDDFKSEEEFVEFCKVFDESDEKTFENVRFRLGKMNTGWGHNSLYNFVNFKNGTLEALERTRRDLSCSSAEKTIDILYELGYSNKRIIYAIWKLGYVNISFRDLRRYIEQNKVKLKNLRKAFMAELEEKRITLFQNMKEEVLSAERKTLKIYLSHLDIYQKELEETDIIAEPTKANRLRKTINEIQAKVDEMHGITKYRESNIKINEQLTLERELKSIKEAPAISAGAVNELDHDSRMLS